MKRLVLVAFGLLLLLGIASAQVDSDATDEKASFDEAESRQLLQLANRHFMPLPTEVEDPDNPLTHAKIHLGKRLYVDPKLSKDGNVSCDSCHSLANFGVDNLPTSPGDAGESGTRNSPTVFNAALHVAQFWDGRAEDVEEQAVMPILNPIEMAIPNEEFLIERLSQHPGYQRMFAAAFPDDEEPLSFGNIGKALGAFERTLLTPAPFDDFLNGDIEALDDEAKLGLWNFVALGCSACHDGDGVGGYSFQKFGEKDDYWVHTSSESIDDGLFALTGDEDDRFVFKVSALRNVERTGPYFHDGSVEGLEEAIAIMGRAQMGRDLSAAESRSIAAFLGSLTGEVPATAMMGPGMGMGMGKGPGPGMGKGPGRGRGMGMHAGDGGCGKCGGSMHDCDGCAKGCGGSGCAQGCGKADEEATGHRDGTGCRHRRSGGSG